MNTLQFSITINAPATKVWKSLWDDANYRQWTSVFTSGSHAKSDWNEGSKIHFLDGKGAGMYSLIEVLTENRQMVFKHLGEIKDNTEQPESSWSGARERYLLEEKNGQTMLICEHDSSGEFENYLKEKFPKALALVKELAEKS